MALSWPHGATKMTDRTANDACERSSQSNTFTLYQYQIQHVINVSANVYQFSNHMHFNCRLLRPSWLRDGHKEQCSYDNGWWVTKCVDNLNSSHSAQAQWDGIVCGCEGHHRLSPINPDVVFKNERLQTFSSWMEIYIFSSKYNYFYRYLWTKAWLLSDPTHRYCQSLVCELISKFTHRWVPRRLHRTMILRQAIYNWIMSLHVFGDGMSDANTDTLTHSLTQVEE